MSISKQMTAKMHSIHSLLVVLFILGAAAQNGLPSPDFNKAEPDLIKPFEFDRKLRDAMAKRHHAVATGNQV